MRIYQTKTIVIHEGCSARCKHCPYGKLQKNSVRTIQSIMEEITGSPEIDLIILTGGEPLEYPFLQPLLQEFIKINKPFRIATGGHVLIKSYIDFLTNIPTFTGFSLGTDHLISERSVIPQARSHWFENLRILNENRIRYSFTITLGYDFSLSFLLKYLQQLNCNPDFFTLCEREEDNFSDKDWDISIETIQKSFLGKKINIGFRNKNICETI